MSSILSASQRPEIAATQNRAKLSFRCWFFLFLFWYFFPRVSLLSKNDVRIKSIHRKNEEPSICSTCDFHKRNKSSDTEMRGKCCSCFVRHIIRLVLAKLASYNLIKKNTRCRNGIDVSAHRCFATGSSLVQCTERQVKQTTTMNETRKTSKIENSVCRTTTTDTLERAREQKHATWKWKHIKPTHSAVEQNRHVCICVCACAESCVSNGNASVYVLAIDAHFTISKLVMQITTFIKIEKLKKRAGKQLNPIFIFFCYWNAGRTWNIFDSCMTQMFTSKPNIHPQKCAQTRIQF